MHTFPRIGLSAGEIAAAPYLLLLPFMEALGSMAGLGASSAECVHFVSSFPALLGLPGGFV